MKKILSILLILSAACLAGRATPVLFPLSAMFNGGIYTQPFICQAALSFITDGTNAWIGSNFSVTPSGGTNPIVQMTPNDYLVIFPDAKYPWHIRVPNTTNQVSAVNLSIGPLPTFLINLGSIAHSGDNLSATNVTMTGTFGGAFSGDASALYNFGANAELSPLLNTNVLIVSGSSSSGLNAAHTWNGAGIFTNATASWISNGVFATAGGAGQIIGTNDAGRLVGHYTQYQFFISGNCVVRYQTMTDKATTAASAATLSDGGASLTAVVAVAVAGQITNNTTGNAATATQATNLIGNLPVSQVSGAGNAINANTNAIIAQAGQAVSGSNYLTTANASATYLTSTSAPVAIAVTAETVIGYFNINDWTNGNYTQLGYQFDPAQCTYGNSEVGRLPIKSQPFAYKTPRLWLGNNVYAFNNYTEITNLFNFTVQAYLEYPSNTFYPITWNGSNSVTFTSTDGTIRSSDFIAGVTVAAGDTAYLRYYLTTPTFGGYPLGQLSLLSYIAPGGVVQQGTNVTLNLTNALALLPHQQPSYSYAPFAFTGVKVDGTAGANISVALVGDSIAQGLSQYSLFYYCSSNSFPLANFGKQGAPANVDTPSEKNAYIQLANIILTEGGINNYRLSGGGQFATMTNLLTAEWKSYYVQGKRVYQTTFTPYTTTTNGQWTNITGQTVFASEADRTNLNNWIMSIPPYLTGYVDLAGACSTNLSYWRPGLTSDGLHPELSSPSSLIQVAANIYPPIAQIVAPTSTYSGKFIGDGSGLTNLPAQSTSAYITTNFSGFISLTNNSAGGFVITAPAVPQGGQISYQTNTGAMSIRANSHTFTIDPGSQQILGLNNLFSESGYPLWFQSQNKNMVFYVNQANSDIEVQMNGTIVSTITQTNVTSRVGYSSALLHTPTAVTVGASPFSFTNNTPSAIECYFDDVAAYSVGKNGTTVYSSTLVGSKYFILQPTNTCVLTFASTTPGFTTNAW